MDVGRARALAGGMAISILTVVGCGASIPPGSPGDFAASATPSAASPAASQVPAAPAVSSTGSGVSVLDVECTATGTKLGADTVGAQADGVHFLVRNASGDDREFEVDGAGGDNAPATAATAVWLVAPGPARVRCQPMDGRTNADWAAFTVEDPAGVYVPDRVTCRGLTSSGIIDYATSATGEQGDPVDIARRHLRGVREGDVVERAGYPATSLPKVRVARDGNVVLVGTFEPTDDGGWHIGMVDSCTESGVTWGA